MAAVDPGPSRSRLTAVAFAALLVAGSCSPSDDPASPVDAISTTSSSTTTGAPSTSRVAPATQVVPTTLAGVAVDRWEGIDLIVWLEPRTDDAVVASLADELTAMSGVVSVVHVDADATFREYESLVPDAAVTVVAPDDLPQSLRLAVPAAGDLAAVVDAVLDRSYVREVVSAPQRPLGSPMTIEPCPFAREARALVVVWMDADATQGQWELLLQRVADDPEADVIDVVDDPAAIWAEFERIFADQPAVVRTTDPDDLPGHFTVAVPTEVAIDGWGREIEQILGVQDVINPMDAAEFGCG